MTTHKTLKPIFIGLCGAAGSGKDTVRSFLENAHDFAGLAFAEPIRAMLRELLISNGCSDEYMERRELKEQPIPGLGVSYRHMAQTLGTEWGRQCLGADFWLNLAATYMADLRGQGYRKFVVSDVRFANEAAWVKAQGGVLWHIQRNVAPVRAHASEQGEFAFDVLLWNTSTVQQLWQAVDAELHKLHASRSPGVDMDAVHLQRASL